MHENLMQSANLWIHIPRKESPNLRSGFLDPGTKDILYWRILCLEIVGEEGSAILPSELKDV